MSRLKKEAQSVPQTQSKKTNPMGVIPRGVESAVQTKVLLSVMVLLVNEDGNYWPTPPWSGGGIQLEGDDADENMEWDDEAADVAEQGFKMLDVSTWIPRPHNREISVLELILRMEFDYWRRTSLQAKEAFESLYEWMEMIQDTVSPFPSVLRVGAKALTNFRSALLLDKNSSVSKACVVCRNRRPGGTTLPTNDTLGCGVTNHRLPPFGKNACGRRIPSRRRCGLRKRGNSYCRWRGNLHLFFRWAHGKHTDAESAADFVAAKEVSPSTKLSYARMLMALSRIERTLLDVLIVVL